MATTLFYETTPLVKTRASGSLYMATLMTLLNLNYIAHNIATVTITTTGSRTVTIIRNTVDTILRMTNAGHSPQTVVDWCKNFQSCARRGGNTESTGVPHASSVTHTLHPS